jgi:hypothetical protein
MPKYSKGLEAIAEHRRKKQYEKALRLAHNKPKWKDEKYMDQKRRQEYVEWYLTKGHPDGEFSEMNIDIEDAKLMQKVWCDHAKLGNTTQDNEKELDMESFLKDGKNISKSEEPTTEEDVHQESEE